MLKILKVSSILILMIFSVNLNAAENKPTKGPIFTQYGPVFKVEETDVPLPKGFKYKAMFAISAAAKNTFNVNRHLESVARYINMHAMNGVKMENMDIAVVIKGEAFRDTLNNKAYQERYLDDNPNLKLIEQLHSKGVKFYLCGQSLYFQQGKKADLAPQVSLALSAMTMATILQSQGYVLIP